MMKQALLYLLIMTILGCAQTEDTAEKWPAARLYAEAKGQLDSGNYSRAVELYEKLEARFPFGAYGQQAILDLAYAYYKDENPERAIASAERFIKLYPQNAHVDYAYYLKGLTNFNRGKNFTQRIFPTDESQRDSGSAWQAFQDFSDLVTRYPNSRYTEDAKLRMIHLRNTLAQHELNVAQYYMRRSAFLAAANRSRYIIEKYPRTPVIPEALTIMAKAYKIMELPKLSADALRVLKLNYPDHPGIFEVQETVVYE